MGSELILGVRLDTQTFSTVKLTDVNLQSKVEELRSETAEKVNLTKDAFDLIYCGYMLEDESTLESCGIKSGTMIHVLKKKDPEPPSSPKPVTDVNIIHLTEAFKFFEENPALQPALHRFSKTPDLISNIILNFPELQEDPVAIAMLQAPELMVHFTDPETVKRIAKAHPVLIEAARYIAIAICKDAFNTTPFGSNGSSSNSQATPFSFSIDHLSDDEEMAGDSSQSSDSTQPAATSSTPASNTSVSNNSVGAITTAHLAAALGRARLQLSSMQPVFTPSPSSIMPPNLPPLLPPILSSFSETQRQLAQMREMGLLNEAANLQALEFTDGDVQAAIELVLSNSFNDN